MRFYVSPDTIVSNSLSLSLSLSFVSSAVFVPALIISFLVATRLYRVAKELPILRRRVRDIPTLY